LSSEFLYTVYTALNKRAW